MNKVSDIFHGWGFWLQVAIVVAVLLLPLTYIENNESIASKHYLLGVSGPVALIAVFYMNYFWLVPQLLKGRKPLYFLVNLAVIIILAVTVQGCTRYLWVLKRGEPTSYPFLTLNILVFLRNAFYLTISAGTAAAVIFSKRWIVSEKNRVEIQKSQREAELMNLRQQVNPHFLLNTLNNIYALTRFDQVKAQEAIMQLSKLLRHILYESEHESVELLEEVNFIHNYVNLMRLRLPSYVKVTEDINIPEQLSIQVAPVIFISLIENAFKHGIDHSSECFVHISLNADNHQIVCHIENSYHPKLKADSTGHGIGLHQVERRLELLYPGRYTWEKRIDKEKKVYSSKITIYDTELHDH